MGLFRKFKELLYGKPAQETIVIDKQKWQDGLPDAIKQRVVVSKPFKKPINTNSRSYSNANSGSTPEPDNTMINTLMLGAVIADSHSDHSSSHSSYDSGGSYDGGSSSDSGSSSDCGGGCSCD
jgi:uncharacterized membrane protein YgcG